MLVAGKIWPRHRKNNGQKRSHHQQQTEQIAKPLEQRRGFVFLKDVFPQEPRGRRFADWPNLQQVDGSERNQAEQGPEENGTGKTQATNPPRLRIS